MRVDILKDKQSWQREELLKDKNLESELVDKLASDASKNVRQKTVQHPNISDTGLWKLITQKKNFDDEYILRNAFHRISVKEKLKWFKEKQYSAWSSQNIFNEIDTQIVAGIAGSSTQQEFTDLFVDMVLSDEFNLLFVRFWLLENYDVKSNKKLFEFFTKKYPHEMIRFNKSLKLSKQEIDALFDAKMQGVNEWSFKPIQTFGYEFLEQMDTDKISKVLQTVQTVSFDMISYLIDNPNLNVQHTHIFLSKYQKNNKDFTYGVSKFPLDTKAEQMLLDLLNKKLEKEFLEAFSILEAWTKNPTHNKSKMLKLLIEWKDETGWSSEIVSSLASSGMYDGADIDKIFDNKPNQKLASYIKAVKNPKFPQPKLKELWQEYWGKQWKKEKISGPSYSGGFSDLSGGVGSMWGDSNEKKIHELVYSLIKYSSSGPEFSVEYYNITNDDKYLPPEVKQIFLML